MVARWAALALCEFLVRAMGVVGVDRGLGGGGGEAGHEGGGDGVGGLRLGRLLHALAGILDRGGGGEAWVDVFVVVV